MRSSSSFLPGASGLDALLRERPDDRPKDLLPYAPNLSGLSAAADRVQRRPYDRTGIVEILVQDAHRRGDATGVALARRLEDPRSLVVIAGQQPHPFGGSLLVFAKAAGAVTLARRLEEALGVPVVPLFWNHSEDHDLDEVNRFAFVESGTVVTESFPWSNDRKSLDALSLDGSDRETASAWLERAGAGSRAAELLPMDGERFADWSGRCVTSLLRGLPLLVLEPRVLRPKLSAFFGRAIEDADGLHESILRQTQALESLGHGGQVLPEDAGYVFFIDDAGRRVRIPRIDRSWHLPLGLSTPEDLAAVARDDPGRLSCNVILRPLAQQWVLPVVAHVNGPAENAYFAQLSGAFRHWDLPQPVAFPRPRLTVLGQKEHLVMERLGLDPRVVLGPPDGWPDATARAGRTPVFEEAEQRLAEVVQRLASAAKEEGLLRAVEGFRKRYEDALHRLEGSFRKDEERRTGIGRLDRHRLLEWTHPRGKPQERVLGPLALYRGHDPFRLGDHLGTIDPLDFRHHLLTLEAED